jgi:hypothetical protein
MGMHAAIVFSPKLPKTTVRALLSMLMVQNFRSHPGCRRAAGACQAQGGPFGSPPLHEVRVFKCQPLPGSSPLRSKGQGFQRLRPESSLSTPLSRSFWLL